MKPSNPLHYVVGRFMGPLGLVLQTAYLSRSLQPDDFADFLYFYALAVIVSAASDGGGRHIFFSEARALARDGGAFRASASKALRVKLGFSALLLVAALLFAGPFSPGGGSRFGYLAAVAFGITMPVGDVHLIGLRAAHRALSEAWILAAEQVAILSLLFLIEPGVGWNASKVLWAMAAIGLSRMALSMWLLRSSLGTSQAPLPKSRQIDRSWLALSLAATLSVIAAQLFHRMPAISLLGQMPSREYSVLVAFLALLLRGQLLMQGLLHAWYGTNSEAWAVISRSTPSLLAASSGLALVLTAPVSLLPELWVGLYLGEDLVAAASMARAAALLMLLCYPLFVVSTLLQYAQRNHVVAVAAAVGSAIQLVLIDFVPVEEHSLVPYATGVVVYLLICVVAVSHLVRSGDLGG